MWAMLFPGQGSQTVGMGRFYYDHFQVAKDLFELASDELKINFKKLCFEEPQETLTLTQNAQPAILLVSCASYFSLKTQIDLSSITYCAGHSVGEYSALVSAEVLSFSSAIKAVHKRALLMSHETGGMSALIGPDHKSAQQFCQWVEQQSGFQPLQLANLNTLEQNVLSGNKQALQWAQEHYSQYSFSCKKVRIIPLKVSGPFHSSLMKPAAQKMKEILKSIPFEPAKRSIIHNTTAKPAENSNHIRLQMAQQITQPVLWLPTIQYLLQKNCTHFLELGPGKVLAGLMKKIQPTAQVSHWNSLDDLKNIAHLKK